VKFVPHKARFSPERLERLRRFIDGFIERGELPCVLFTLSHRNETVLRHKVGWQNVTTQQPVTFDTIFRIMSMTKPVTAVAAMMLYEEGRFHLNTPVADFFPAFNDVQVMAGVNPDGSLKLEPAASPVTIRHLFTHTSGLSYGGDANDPIDKLYQADFARIHAGSETITLAEMMARLAKLPLVFQPGKGFRYGMNQDALMALVEQVAGMPAQDFYRQRIFAPLGMVDTDFYVPEAKHDRLAALHCKDSNTNAMTTRTAPTTMPVIMQGGGGLSSTLADYSRFAAMLANGGELEGVRLLSPTTVGMFATNQASAEASNMYSKNMGLTGGLGYSLATSVVTEPVLTGRYGHAGEFYWAGAFSTYFWVDPAAQLYAMWLTQFDPNIVFPIGETLKQLVYAAMI
jgi:CubicO group peptidase (beta-lactamase class C family)